MEKILLTCVECPLGCAIEVIIEKDKISSVTGNTCPRGKLYAQNEVICPMRVLTTTVNAGGDKMLAVKTDKPVPRDVIFELIKTINDLTVSLPVSIGQVLVKGVYGDVNVVATDDLR